MPRKQMETTMFRKFLATALTTTLLATAAPVFAETMVKDVAVTADLTAVQNESAGAHWATLTDDLKNAIVTRLGSLVSPEGQKLSVDIDSVELANTLQSAAGVADSKLVGTVTVTGEDNSKFDSYILTVSFADAGPFFPEGTDLTKITSDSKEYYDAMIATFADHVVSKLQ
jgi:hypothetical protein